MICQAFSIAVWLYSHLIVPDFFIKLEHLLQDIQLLLKKFQSVVHLYQLPTSVSHKRSRSFEDSLSTTLLSILDLMRFH